MSISSAIFLGGLALTPGLASQAPTPEPGAELVWPSDPRAFYRDLMEARSGEACSPASWPRAASEICNFHPLGDDTASNTTVTFLPLLHELCREQALKPPLKARFELGAFPQNQASGLGRPFEVFNSAWNSVLVGPEVGRAWSDLPPALNLELQHAFSPRAFIYFRMGLRRDVAAWHKDDYRLNVPFSANEVDLNEPSRGYLHFEGDWMTFTAGRFPIHWSPSPEFSLALSDAVPYHNGVSWALKMQHVRYRFLISSLNPWLEGTPPSGPGEDYPAGSEEWRQRHYPVIGQSDNAHNRIYDARMKTLFAHRLEAWLGPIALGVTETNVVGGKPIDFRDANPFAVFHNDFREGYSNNGVSLDALARLPSGLAMAGEIYMDDIEYTETEGDVQSPSILGLMGSLRHSFPLRGWAVSHSLHVVRTDPFLYGAHQPLNVASSRHILTSNFQLDGPIVVDKYVVDYPLGYLRGGDALDFWYRAEARSTRLKLKIGAGILAKGEVDLGTPYESYYSPHGEAPTGMAERELRLQALGTWRWRPGMDVTGGASMSRFENKRHFRGKGGTHFLMTAGASWTFPH